MQCNGDRPLLLLAQSHEDRRQWIASIKRVAALTRDREDEVEDMLRAGTALSRAGGGQPGGGGGADASSRGGGFAAGTARRTVKVADARSLKWAQKVDREVRGTLTTL